MIDVFEVAELLVENVRETFAADVAVIAYYGSYATGTPHAKSDLDIFFVPDADHEVPAAIQFVLDGIGFDFWPIGWERAERIAAFEEPIVSVIADARILYARSEGDRERFEALQAGIARLCAPASRATMVRKAVRRLEGALRHLWRLGRDEVRGDPTATRLVSYLLLTELMFCLALVNQTYFRRGWGESVRQLPALELQPPDLERLLAAITRSLVPQEIRDACARLFEGVAELLEGQYALVSGPAPWGALFAGFYEESRGLLHKIALACDRGDYPTAYLTAVGFQNELSWFLAEADRGAVANDGVSRSGLHAAFARHGLPDLASIASPGRLPELKEAAAALDRALRELLAAHGVGLNEFASLGGLRDHLRARAARRGAGAP